ncbi:MAG: hypothetical protein JWQ72_2809, partial [Polaromonas sp.]|nr:hypothetical protein [Polaromonas sp.]
MSGPHRHVPGRRTALLAGATALA